MPQTRLMIKGVSWLRTSEAAVEAFFQTNSGARLPKGAQGTFHAEAFDAGRGRSEIEPAIAGDMHS